MAYFDQMEISSKHGIDVRRDVKWKTSMMFPEHVAFLRKYNEEIMKIDRPILDEQELEILDETIHLAMEEARSISITYFVNGKITEYTGDIRFLT